MAGNNKVDPFIKLLKGIKILNDEVSQLCSEVKKLTVDEYRVVGNRKY